ncbi:MAG: hypothetical protein WCF78_00425 [archaeon]
MYIILIIYPSPSLTTNSALGEQIAERAYSYIGTEYGSRMGGRLNKYGFTNNPGIDCLGLQFVVLGDLGLKDISTTSVHKIFANGLSIASMYVKDPYSPSPTDGGEIIKINCPLSGGKYVCVDSQFSVLQPGDLIYFPSHAAIYYGISSLGNPEIIEAPNIGMQVRKVTLSNRGQKYIVALRIKDINKYNINDGLAVYNPGAGNYTFNTSNSYYKFFTT